MAKYMVSPKSLGQLLLQHIITLLADTLSPTK